MIKIEQLITSRKTVHEFYMDLVYEWEDEFKQELNVPFFHERYFRGRRKLLAVIKRFPFLSFLLQTRKPAFLFELSDWRFNDLNNAGNIIPCIVDFYVRDPEINYFVRMHRNNRLIFVTSRQAYDYLLSKNLPFDVQHLPLSLPTKYKLSPHMKFEKKYDMLILGRSNPVLLSFVKRYASIHSNFVYVYSRHENEHFVCYTSNGKCLGNKDSRSDYLDLLRQGRVCIYSTSGMDNDKAQTEGFHQVTPRFLEMLACGCHVMARYERNSDTDYYELSQHWPSIDNYEQFSSCLDSYLDKAPDLNFYSNYLEKHYTCKRIEQLKNALKEIQL